MTQKIKHFITVEDLTQKKIQNIFETAKRFEDQLKTQNALDILEGKILVTLFFEASTRTRISFETAMLKCGGKVVTVDGNFSSIQKGESLSDMGHVLSDYADAIVMRHPKPNSVKELATQATVPVINAGDGSNQHPTQALLDLYTILKEKTVTDQLNIGFLGDLKHSRTVHSLLKLLKQHKITLTLISDPSLKLPKELKKEYSKNNIQETENLEEAIPKLDVLYVTRVQQERFEKGVSYFSVKDKYFLTLETLKRAKKDLLIMHPLPRVNEIDPAIDKDPRAAYFRQSKNGVFVRMALLNELINN